MKDGRCPKCRRSFIPESAFAFPRDVPANALLVYIAHLLEHLVAMEQAS